MATNPRGTSSTVGSNSSSSTLNSFLTILRVETKWMASRSTDEAERSAGIARVSDLRMVRLNTTKVRPRLVRSRQVVKQLTLGLGVRNNLE